MGREWICSVDCTGIQGPVVPVIFIIGGILEQVSIVQRYEEVKE